MLLALDFLVQWPPLIGVGNSEQNQNTYTPRIYTYLAESYNSTAVPLIWYFTVESLINVSGTADVTFVSNASPDIIVSGSADCEFIPAQQIKQRGGRGAYTKRIRRVAQPHIYIYEPHYKEVIQTVSGFATCEFIKHVKYEFIKTLSIRDDLDDEYAIEIITPVKPKPTIFNYVADTTINAPNNGINDVVFFDKNKQLRAEEEELLLSLLDDSNEDYIFSTMYDHYGDKMRKDDYDILKLLDMI